MDFVCPLCNGLAEYKVKCEICGTYMVDEGPLVNYFDDYSPYLPRDITQKIDGAPYNNCVHLFRCVECNNDKRVEIQRVRI